MNNRGQFSIIAALLVAIVLIGTLIAVYAMIRYDSSQNQPPQSLTATDETNLAIQKALGFTVGYYGSMLQVTGNQTFAEVNATAYMKNALQYIESMNPSWGESISMTSLNLRTNWFSNPSISEGQLSVVYDLTNLGIYGINYTTSCSLGVQIFKSPNSNQVCLNVTQDSTEPLTSLGQQNFAFYSYNYTTSNWQLENPKLGFIVFTNGTYLINTPSGISSSAFMLQVTDSRGIMVEASSYNSYNLDFTYGSQSMTQSSPVVVQLLQNGTMQTFGTDLVNTTQALPIPPISVKSLNLCQTGSTTDIPFQVEDWASQYRIPLGLTSNYTIFSSSQMIVFEVTPSTSQLTLWWNGSDTATQSPSAYTDKYFTGDNPGAGTLSNGKMTLQFSYPNGGVFTITSTVKSATGTVTSTTSFMRINGATTNIGSGSPAYVIQNGVIRDIVQEEAEWSSNGGGPPNCKNVYAPMVITFPANSTYFTYQLRLIFINSTVSRSITDISPLQLTTSISPLQAFTENGTNPANEIPIVSGSNGYFNDSTGSAHHWSELVNANNNLQGTGLMQTTSANQQLYVFDSMTNPHAFTGALKVSSTTPVIELDPVTPGGPVSFTTAMDVTWYGAVATFNGANPIYASSGNSGLWSLVEQPPSVTITPQFSAAASITLSPSSGNTGTSVTASGGGFQSNSQITITFNGIKVKTVTATSYGAIPSGTTFTVPSSPFGSYAVTATDTSSNSASTIFTLTPLDHFAVTASGGGSIGTQTAGTAFSITITAENSTGYTVTSYTGTNTLTVSSGTISPTSTGAFTAGVWTGSVTLTTSGSGITIGTTGSSKSGTSNAFTVNPGAATHFVVSGFPNPTTAGVANSVTVTAYDAYGNVATGYAGTVKITSSDPKAVLPANAGLTNGVGTFSVTLETAGTQSITATDTVTSTITGSQTGITVSAGSLSKFVLSAPSSATAGTAFTLTVTAEDAYGNTVTTYSSSVPLSASSGSISPTSTGTSGWSNGVWSSGSVTLTAAGSITITANDGSGHTGTATLTVNPGALSKFAVNAPSTATAGTAFTLTVTAQDAYGNTVISYSSSVSLSASSGTISPTSTGTSGWSSGVWSSNSATLTAAGSITITANDGSGHTGTASVTVSAGALSKFAVGAPTSATAGTGFTLTVTAEDTYGNPIKTYDSSVTLSASAGTISPTSTGTSGWSNGVWSSSSVTLTTAGSITITASDGNGHTGTATLTVNAAAASKLVVSGFPSSVTAGSANSVTVTAEDQYGNTATSFSGTVTITSSDGKAVLPSPGKLTNGVGSFSVTLETAGTQSITASASGVTSGSQIGITVIPGVLYQFAFSTVGTSSRHGGYNVNTGTPYSVTITAEDQYGNTVTNFNGAETITGSGLGADSISSPSGGSITFTAGVWTGSITISGTSNENNAYLYISGYQNRDNSNTFNIVG
jgi:hypothetical protein